MPPLDPLDLLPLRLNLGAMPAIWLLLREIDPIAGLLILTSGVDLEGGHTEIVEIACSCWHGQQYQIWFNRKRHPEYENPYQNLTDAETLAAFNTTIDREALIESEFNL